MRYGSTHSNIPTVTVSVSVHNDVDRRSSFPPTVVPVHPPRTAFEPPSAAAKTLGISPHRWQVLAGKSRDRAHQNALSLMMARRNALLLFRSVESVLAQHDIYPCRSFDMDCIPCPYSHFVIIVLEGLSIWSLRKTTISTGVLRGCDG